MRIRTGLGLLFLLMVAASSMAEDRQVTAGRSVVATEYGIVAASQPLAARAGVAILERGGNAIDAAIAHRGPDDAANWKTSHGPHHVCLIHRRLSILDLEHGQQPMHGTDSRHVITYNGEIFNSPQLRDKLIEKFLADD